MACTWPVEDGGKEPDVSACEANQIGTIPRGLLVGYGLVWLEDSRHLFQGLRHSIGLAGSLGFDVVVRKRELNDCLVRTVSLEGLCSG